MNLQLVRSAPFVEPDPLEWVSGPSLAGKYIFKNQTHIILVISGHDCYRGSGRWALPQQRVEREYHTGTGPV